ncbi:protein of unknown function (plasmid) [Methylocella tundrae]|uniref:Uncharacterized protein n=1 Tax=Methylocella tundrae TaxID=227605 RepID=A0A4U8Z720_METTU|nr:protein of unknown function [Methylocella tundrae]
MRRCARSRGNPKFRETATPSRQTSVAGARAAKALPYPIGTNSAVAPFPRGHIDPA